MRILKAVLVLLAVAVMVGRYFQERKRLAVMQQMSGERARDHYEAARRGGDTFLVVLTALFAAGAATALGYYFLHFLPQSSIR